MTTVGHHIATVRQFDPSTGIATVVIPALYGATPIQARPFVAAPAEVADLTEVAPGSTVIAFYDDGDPTTVLRWYSTGGGGQLADMPANRLKGVIAAGEPQDLTAAQSRSVITSDASSFGVPTTLYLRGDGSFGIPPGGGGIDVEAAQDVTGALFTGGVNSLISAVYQDEAVPPRIDLSISDPDLVTIAGLVPTTGNVIQSVAGAWSSQSTANLKTSLNLVKGDVGLSNVDNTSDANKPVSTATQTALNLKFDKAGGTVTGPTTFSSTVTGAAFFGDGAGLTNLHATNIATGTLAKERLPLIIDSNTTGSAAKWTTARTITLGGDLTGNVSIDGSNHVTLNATIAQDSIVLGTDTVGNYIASLTGTAKQVIVNGVIGEAAAYTLSTPQDIDTLANPTFNRLTLGQATGTAPMVVGSTTKVVNLNADQIDGYEGAYLLDWANFTSKPDPVITVALTGPVQGSAAQTWTDLIGNVSLSIATTIPGGPGSTLNADLLDGLDSTHFLNATNLTSGTLPSGRLTGTYTINIIGGVTGNVTGNADTATKLKTPITIAGKTFDGSANVVLSTLTRGGFLTGANYDGSTATTWAVDAVSTNTASKVVARDASGNFAANEITASRLHSNVVTGTAPLSVISTTLVPNLNVEQLQGYVPSDFADREMMESLLGDLRLIGAYDAAAYSGSWVSMPPSRLLSRMSAEPLMLDAHNIITYANLIANSSFAGTPVGGLAPGWTRYTGGAISGVTNSIGTTDVRAGQQWQRLNGTYSQGGQTVFHTTPSYATLPGLTYQIKVIVRGTIPALVAVDILCAWTDNVGAVITYAAKSIAPSASYWNTFTYTTVAPANAYFGQPMIQIIGGGGASNLAATLDVLRVEFSQAPELVNAGQAGNAIMMGDNLPVLHPDADESYFWFPAAAGNDLTWTFPAAAADASMDWRCRFRWDGHGGRAQNRVWNNGLYMAVWNNGLYVSLHATDSSYPAVVANMPDTFPAIGEWVDMRGVWDASTDTVRLDWKPATGSLLDSTGWITAGSTVAAGRQHSSATTRGISHGIGDGGFHFNGAIKQTALYVNGVLTTNIDVKAMADPSVASFVAQTGQTVTINRTGVFPTQLIPARFYDGRSVILLSTGNYLVVPDHARLNFTGTESMTTLLTLRQTTAPTAFGRYLYKYGVGGTTPGYMISPNSPVTQQRAIVETPTVISSFRTLSATADRKRKTWGIRVDRAAGQVALIDDGALGTPVAITPAAATLANNGPLYLGVGANGTANPATYEFMSALMVREALTTTELQEFVDAAARGSDLYQHGTYWVCSSSGTLDYIDSDWSLRYEITDDDSVDVFNGDWILCFDPFFGDPGHEVGTWHPRQEMVFQYVPFSAETYVKSQIADHVAAEDPHTQYVLWAEGVTSFAPFSHDHPDEIATAIALHESKADPHSQYLTEIEGGALFMPIGRNFDSEILDGIRVHELKTDPHQQYLLNAEADLRYEVIGTVTAHEAKPDPHPIYLTASEADVRYDVAGKLAEHEAKADPHPQYLTEVEGIGLFSPLVHNHNDRYYDKTEVDAFFNIRVEDEVTAVDVAQSARVWVGGTTKPANPRVGDLWFSAPPADQLIPTEVAEFNFSPTSSTSISLYWVTWPAAANVTEIDLESSPNNSTWTPVVGSPLAASATTYVDTTAVTENLVRYYRIRAVNAIGLGPWSTSLTANSANIDPPPPTALVASGQTPTSIVLSWTPPSWTDPGASGARYEVYRNGTSMGFALSTTATYTFTGLSENVQYNLGVRSKDSGGRTSAIVTLNNTTTKTTNAPPPNAPTGVTITPSTTLPSVTTTWTAPTLPADFLNYEVQVVRTSDSVALQTKTTTALTATFDDVAWGTQVFCRVRVKDALGAGSAYANSSNATTRDNPVVTMGTPTLSNTDMTITWTAPPTQVADFTGYTLNIYDGGGTTVLGSVAMGSGLSQTFNAVGYSTSRRFAVVITRSGSLAPVISGYSPAATTMADPAPRNTGTSASGNTINCGWIGAAVQPNDITGYRCRLWSGSVISEQVVGGGSASFGGLSYATNYNFDVRTERANGQHSSFVGGPIATTGPHPDTTPPGHCNITAWHPFNNYGEMHIQGYYPGDADFSRVVVYRIYSGGPGWEVIVDGGASPGAFFSHYMGNFAGGTYIEIAIDCYDNRGNVQRTPHVGYTVVSSPTYVYADATNYWRSTNGGEYNPAGNYKMYYGYFSVSSYNAVSYIYYGYKIADACAGRTVVGMNMYLHREGGGNNAADVITTYIHNELWSPGTVAYIGGNAWIGGNPHDWGTLTYGQAAWAPLSGEQVGNLVAGYRGVALYRPSGKPYMFLYALSANGSQGLIQVFHLG